MALSNNEHVGKGLKFLNKGLIPFVEREMKSVYGDLWVEQAQSSLREDRSPTKKKVEPIDWDTQALLAVIWNHWNSVFKKSLGHAERSFVSELREVRKDWAHQKIFNTEVAYRALDSMQRLLTSISADEATEVGRHKQEMRRVLSGQNSPPQSRTWTNDFKNALAKVFKEELGKRMSRVDVNAGDLHRKVGGYPGPSHRMPICCNVMLSEMGADDIILSQPPKGKGASLTIRYVIPRPTQT